MANGNGLDGSGVPGHRRNSEYWVHVVQSRVHQLAFP